MNLTIRTVADNDIMAIKDNSLKLEILHYGEVLDVEALEDEEEDFRDELLRWKPQFESELFYVEGSFQALHYLLTGDESHNAGVFPLNFLQGHRLVLGEIGWGQANFYTSADTQEIYEALNKISPAELIKKYNHEVFNKREIYPRGYVWKREDATSLRSKIEEMVVFLRRVTLAGKGVYLVLE